LNRRQGSKNDSMRISVLERQRPASLLLVAILLLLSGASCGHKSADRACLIELTPYFYIQETSGQKGGMPTQVTTTYLSADGVGQIAEETSDDAVVKLRTSSVRPKQFFDDLTRVSFPTRAGAGAGPPGNLVTEYIPPSIFVEIGEADGKARSWLGNPGDMPKELASIISKATGLVKAGDKFGLHAGSRYIRATVLTALATNDMREAGVLREATASEVGKVPLVGSAISHPRMLVAVDGTANPYSGLGAFSRGRSVALSVGKLAFQVRNLEKVDRLGRKGNTE